MITQWIERARRHWADCHPRWRFLLVTLLAAAAMLFGVKPAYQWFKDWRSARNLEAAQMAIAEVRMGEARDLSMTVLRAGDPRIEVFRILEKSMAALQDPMHVEIARALMNHPEGSDEDRLNGFRGVAPEAPMGIVGQAWAALPERCRQRPEFAAVFADRLLAAQRLGEAAGVLLAVPETARNEAVIVGLIRVLLRSGKPEGYEEAQWRIAAQWPTSGTGLAAWVALLEEIPVQWLRAKPLAPVRKFLDLAAAAEPARDDLALALARLDYAANFSGRAGVIDDTIANWQTAAPVAVAKFLRDLGLPQRLLATFPVGQGAISPALLPYVLEALEQTGAWAEVKPLLTASGGQMAKCELQAHLALAAWKAGDTTTTAEHWEAAMGEAKFSKFPDAFLKISGIAQAGGMAAEAAQAMLGAVLQGRGPLPLYRDLQPLVEWLAKQGRESSLLQVGAIYLLFEPSNPVLLTQYAYLACLNGLVEPAKLLKAIRPMAEAFPAELPMQCVLATAYLCNGEAAAAAAVLDRLTVAPEQLAPGYRATFLATQVLNQRMERQDPRIAGLSWKSLLPSERKRFGEWLKMVPP